MTYFLERDCGHTKTVKIHRQLHPKYIVLCHPWNTLDKHRAPGPLLQDTWGEVGKVIISHGHHKRFNLGENHKVCHCMYPLGVCTADKLRHFSVLPFLDGSITEDRQTPVIPIPVAAHV